MTTIVERKQITQDILAAVDDLNRITDTAVNDHDMVIGLDVNEEGDVVIEEICQLYYQKKRND